MNFTETISRACRGGSVMRDYANYGPTRNTSTAIKRLTVIACLTVTATAAAYPNSHAFIWDSTTGMTDLGSLGGDSKATGINDSGQIVGYSYLADQTTIHMVTWTTQGGIVDLGSLDNSTFSRGDAINSVGDIVGTGYDVNGYQVIFFWSTSTGYVNLGEISGSPSNAGHAINDSDVITGEVYPPAQNVMARAIVWRPSFPHARYLGTLPGGTASIGRGINNLGHITGTANRADRSWYGFVWTKVGGMRGIGTVGQGSATIGIGINDNDEVVGSGGVPLRPFYWRESTGILLMRTLEEAAEALAINNSGAITGYSYTGLGPFHAMLWSGHNAAPQDLGTLPGGTVSVGNAINSSGQIVGWGDFPP